jgi:hypothetical protein
MIPALPAADTFRKDLLLIDVFIIVMSEGD